ncbi:AraC family transcriptional regulator [bacterium]|nr:AraC family transcriptional regulator [bacterium]
MRRSPTVSKAVVKNDFELIVQMGMSPERLETITGLERSRLDYSDERLPIWPTFQICQAANESVADPAFALRIGENTSPRSLGIFGNIIMNCCNLGEMIEPLCRYYPVSRELTRVETRLEKDRIFIIFDVQAPEGIRHLLVEKFFATTITFVRQLSGREIRPLEMRFCHPPVSYTDQYQRIFRCPLFFNHFENAIVFKTEYLEYQCCHYNSEIKEILSSHIELLLPDHQIAQTFQEQVRAVILKHLHQGKIDIEMVSDRFRMSRWTLNRKLSAEGTSFQDILADIRKNLAVDYLKNSGFSILQIANLLGFTNQSCFPKAFKRWYGLTPLEYRRYF